MPTLHAHSSTTLLEEPRRRKRSYHDFLHPETHAESPSSSPRLRFSITPSPSDLPNMSGPSPLPPRRFPGDGFDYRRPVMSTDVAHPAPNTPTAPPDVIDLTNDSDTSPSGSIAPGTSIERMRSSSQLAARRHHDQRQQRRPAAPSALQMPGRRGSATGPGTMDFGRVAPPPDPNEPSVVNDEDFLALFQESSSSPGFEITGERSVPGDPPRRSVAERRPTPYVTEEERAPSEVRQLPPPFFRNLPHGLASWIAQAAGSRITGGDRAGRAGPNTSHERLRINQIPYAYTPVPEHNTGSGWQPQPQVQLPRLPALDAFQRPRLNYEAQGFELIGAAHSSPPPRSSSPYKAPRAATQGFTRKVEEDEMVVCPHCGHELGTGEDDLKQQIWVVKQCGHVYCGECAMNRHVGRSKKMAPQIHGKPEPFKTCVVRDCKKPVTYKNALFPVYL